MDEHMGRTGDEPRPGPDAELRLAVAFTGGLSLAVWMGGVARELNLLTTAARADASDDPAGLVRARYRKLLDLLRFDVSVDVLSGTSAGGINAAVLGLATVHGCDLGGDPCGWTRERSGGSCAIRTSRDRPPSSRARTVCCAVRRRVPHSPRQPSARARPQSPP